MNRRLALVMAFGITPFAIVAACTFPDVTFATPDSSTEGSTADGPGNGDGGLPSIDGPNIVEANAADVALPDAAACEAGLLKPCDCDNDGYADKRCDAGTIEAGGLKPGDCDDLNPGRHPGIQDFSTTPTTDGDWNCDGNPERAWKEGTTWCVARNLGGLLSCSPDQGFNRALECGQSADFHTCVGTPPLVACQMQVKDPNNRQAPQACR
jgi:hypothetical protein